MLAHAKLNNIGVAVSGSLLFILHSHSAPKQCNRRDGLVVRPVNQVWRAKKCGRTLDGVPLVVWWPVFGAAASCRVWLDRLV